jgi:hypothetical protein
MQKRPWAQRLQLPPGRRRAPGAHPALEDAPPLLIQPLSPHRAPRPGGGARCAEALGSGRGPEPPRAGQAADRADLLNGGQAVKHERQQVGEGADGVGCGHGRSGAGRAGVGRAGAGRAGASRASARRAGRLLLY